MILIFIIIYMPLLIYIIHMAGISGIFQYQMYILVVCMVQGRHSVGQDLVGVGHNLVNFDIATLGLYGTATGRDLRQA